MQSDSTFTIGRVELAPADSRAWYREIARKPCIGNAPSEIDREEYRAYVSRPLVVPALRFILSARFSLTAAAIYKRHPAHRR